MKIRKSSRANQDGVAVIIMLALLTLVLIFISTNMRTLANLHRDLKVIEQRQIRRLNQSTTNSPAATTNSLTAQLGRSVPQ